MAKASAKKVEDAARLRYIRVLERFTGSITKYLFKAEEPTREQFDKRVDNNRKYLDRVEKTALYKGDYHDLESLVKKILAYRESHDGIEAIKEDILYTANQKHASEMFKDWE